MGAKLRYEQFDDAHHKVLAVSHVYEGSPAQTADFKPYRDFIVGTKELTFEDIDSFAKYISVNENQSVSLYVYNIDSEKVRSVEVSPRGDWGGQGLIGADVSFGFLNRLPMRKQDIENMRKADLRQNNTNANESLNKSCNSSTNNQSFSDDEHHQYFWSNSMGQQVHNDLPDD